VNGPKGRQCDNLRCVSRSLHVYLTDRRAVARVVYIDPRNPLHCGIELVEPRNIWGVSVPPDNWDEGAKAIESANGRCQFPDVRADGSDLTPAYCDWVMISQLVASNGTVKARAFPSTNPMGEHCIRLFAGLGTVLIREDADVTRPEDGDAHARRQSNRSLMIGRACFGFR